MSFDLHTHSTRSDGTTAPADNAARAASAGLTGFALTDHDTFDGWAEAGEAARAAGIELVPGVELSTELGGLSVHLLGYWVDPGDAALAAECHRLRDERLLRAERIVARLAELGVDISLGAVLARAGDAPVGRPHLAAELVAVGAVPDRDTAFTAYLADGAPAYVPKHALAPAEGVRLVRDAGGAAVLAHPGANRGPEPPGPPGAGDRQAPITDALVAELTAAGLAGLEVDHPSHDDVTRARWRRVAGEHDLVVTGSSDFHGEHPDEAIGSHTTTDDAVRALRERTLPVGALRDGVHRQTIAAAGREEESEPW